MEAVGGHKSKVKSDMNVVPLIDIMLVLLIIFMATSSFITESKMKINLPTPDVKPQEENPEKQLLLSITDKGEIYLQMGSNEEKVPMDNLKKKLQEELKGRKDKTVLLKADKSALYGRVVKVMDSIKIAGGDVALATVAEEQ